MTPELLREVIGRELRDRLAPEFENIKSEMIRKLDIKKDEIIASIAIHILESVEFTKMGNTLSIVVKTDQLK